MLEFITTVKQHTGWTVAVGLLALFGVAELIANIVVGLRKKEKKNADM